jgi:hypothetical protein
MRGAQTAHIVAGLRVVFTQHARERMQDPRRGAVSDEEVVAVLRSPEVRYTGVDGKSNVLGSVGGKSLRVCFVEAPGELTVITVINRRGDDAGVI